VSSKGNEQRAATYRRKQPPGNGTEQRSLAEQQRAIEKAFGANSPRGRLVASLLTAVVAYEDEERAARERETAERAALARDVAATHDADRAADELTLAEVGRIRRAYKLAEAATPRVIIKAHEQQGMNAAEIARELDVAPTYTARIIREHKAATEGEA